MAATIIGHAAWAIRRKDGLVPSECAVDEGPVAEGVRRELYLGHELTRSKIWRRHYAGYDAMALARWPGID